MSAASAALRTSASVSLVLICRTKCVPALRSVICETAASGEAWMATKILWRCSR